MKVTRIKTKHGKWESPLKAAHYEYGARQGVRGWYARRL